MNTFKIHLFHTKYISILLTYLLTYHLKLSDIKIINFIWSATRAQCTFINIKPKMCFYVTIDEDCMIFE